MQVESVTIRLPEKVIHIINTLKHAGFEAYAVGGCVRDSLLGRTPKDWDITTSAAPGQVKRLFSRTIDTGIQHGTVTVMAGRDGFEVTTYRIDGEYKDARHPKEVTFTSSLKEDLKRRDFTINAMAYNPEDGLIDYFHGMEDMEREIIRCVGKPAGRFTEDALRMMRAVRFAGQLGFAIEAKTCEAIHPLAENLSRVSAERIQSELVKLLVSQHPEKFLTAYETGMTRVFLPEFDLMMETLQNNCYHCYNVGIHSLEAVRQIRADKILRLTMLLHDVGKPVCKTVDEAGVSHFYGHPEKGACIAGKILKRLKFENETIRRVTGLILWHDDTPALEPGEIRHAIYRTGTVQFPALFEVKRADNLAKNVYMRAEKLAYIDGYEKMYQEIMAKGQCLELKDLAVNGKDLIALGLKPGKELGEQLQRLLEHVLDVPEDNEKETLLKLVKIPKKI